MVAQSRRPTEAELAILAVLWRGGPQSVRDVQKMLNYSRPMGYTSVLKLLQIMTEKGSVKRDEGVRPQIYRAHYSQGQFASDLVSRFFNGSVKAFLIQALSNQKITAKELTELERLLSDFDGCDK